MIEKPQKPKSQNTDLAHLPLALAPLCQLPHWVNWKWEQRASKGTLQWTKPPYQPTGVKAKSDSPDTWSDYQAVLKAFNRGTFGGIGLMLRTTTLTTIDLDHALDDNGQPDPWAIELLRMANGTYVERTPSGKGLRIIGVGPGERLQRRWTIKGGREGAAIEIYRNCERYITVTGNQVGDCTKLQTFDADPIVQQYDKAKTSKKKKMNGGFDFNDAGPQSSSIDYDEVIRNGAPNGQRSELFQASVWHLAAKGLSIEEIVAELEQYPRGIGEKYAGRLKEEVERSFAKWSARSTRRSGSTPEPATLSTPSCRSASTTSSIRSSIISTR
jgi:putative DNA primase/helicase